MKRVTWAIQNIWVQLFDLTFNSSPNRSQNTIESNYGYDCSWLKWSNIHWKWKWSNIFFKYLSSEIMELEKMRGEVHILVYCPIDTFQWGSTHSALVIGGQFPLFRRSGRYLHSNTSYKLEVVRNWRHLVYCSHHHNWIQKSKPN